MFQIYLFIQLKYILQKCHSIAGCHSLVFEQAAHEFFEVGEGSTLNLNTVYVILNDGRYEYHGDCTSLRFGLFLQLISQVGVEAILGNVGVDSNRFGAGVILLNGRQIGHFAVHVIHLFCLIFIQNV